MTRRLPALGAVLAVVGLVLVVLHQRSAQHLVNVDDYLYSRQADLFWQSLTSSRIGVVDAWKQFGVNSPLVPTLAAPAAALDRSPSGFVLVQLPLSVVLLVATAELLRRAGWPSGWRWAAGIAVVALPPVLTYTGMLSFALAASAALVLSLAAYLSSDRLRARRACVGLGVALGLLSLSRVVALVYLAAIGLPMLVDVLLDRTDRTPRARNLAIVLGVAGVIAAPWWLTAGPRAVHYLLQAGYGSGAFTTHRSLLENEQDRLLRTADETGLLLAVLLVAAFVVGTAAAVSRRRDPDARGVLVLSGSVVLGMLMLGTSSNAGTAFALPFEVLAAVVAVTGTRLVLRRRATRVTLAGLAALAAAAGAVGVLSSAVPTAWHGHQLWLSGLPARSQLQAALGCTCPLPDAAAVNRDVYRLIGTSPTLVLRDDALVNPESLRFLAQLEGKELALSAPAGATVDPAQRDAATYVLAGSTAAPYLLVDLSSVDAQLRAAGFTEVLHRQLSAASTVELWKRG